MSTYLSRPVFDYAINWEHQPTRKVSYDLRPAKIGHAAPRQEPLQTQATRTWTFDVLLETEAAISSFDAFTLAARGRLVGFWFPDPLSCGEILATASGDSLDVKWTGNNLTWSDDLCFYLVIQNGSSWQYGKVTAVTHLNNGRQRITLEADGSRTLAVGYQIRQLLYVRLASDVEEWSWINPLQQTRKVSVVELPTEYAELHSGTRPVFLYDFEADHNGTAVHWRLTSLDADISSTLGGGISYTFSSKAITHRGHRRSMRADQDDVTLESWFESGNPLAQFIPFSLMARLKVTIYKTTYSAPNTVTTVFTGFIEGVEANGARLTAKASSLVTVLGRKFPRMLIQPRCNYVLGSAACGVTLASYSATATVDTQEGRYLTLIVTSPPISANSQSDDANFWAYGRIEYGSGSAWQMREIESSTAVFSKGANYYMGITLIAEPVTDLTGLSVTIRAGCDLTHTTCDAKFDNFTRWGGHVVPLVNPSVRAMEAEVANGNKK